ncbi:hypothetical protein [Streptomyces sp. NPDC060198]|uniref:hypothetical protein n=1 Tax=Streptomyces sp. NPDC060198 TaxID=3347070 RepID=UPI00365285C0
MKLGQAHPAATDWVHRFARPRPGYRGACFSGSTAGLPDEAELSPTSAVDVHIATTASVHAAGSGRLRHRGALLEISHVPWAEQDSAEAAIASYHLSGCLRADNLTASATPVGTTLPRRPHPAAAPNHRASRPASSRWSSPAQTT